MESCTLSEIELKTSHLGDDCKNYSLLALLTLFDRETFHFPFFLKFLM